MKYGVICGIMGRRYIGNAESSVASWEKDI